MADREFKLRLGIPKEFPRELPETSCSYADGLEDCCCVKDHRNYSIEDCGFYGRPLEPLAFYLPAFSHVNQQKQSRLYTIPKEIRDYIFEYALTDDVASSFDRDNWFRRHGKGSLPSVNCACTLLQTCKAIYLETYRLPILLNGYLAYNTNIYLGNYDGSRFNGPTRPSLRRIAPWQYALIPRIDLSYQQNEIENSLLGDLQLWQPNMRHSGAYVSPRYYTAGYPWIPCKDPEIYAHNFALVPARTEKSTKGIEDGDKVTLRRWDVTKISYTENLPFEDRVTYGKFIAAAMVARMITHLTLRMSRTDWWTWEDDPDTEDSNQKLSLDPALGGRKTIPSLQTMIALANSRRAGHHPQYDEPDLGTWGAAIGGLPDLKTFELVLETFAPKRKQLETVVDCARTWKFPIKETEYELVCDDRIEARQWRLPGDESEDASKENNNASEHTKELFKEDNDTPEGNEEISEGEHSEDDSELDLQYSDSDSEATFSGESWVRECTEFEVRVVRFRRRRANSGL